MVVFSAMLLGLVWIPSFQAVIMKFISDFILNLFGCHAIGHVILFGIPANAYCMLCQFLFLTLSFLFPNHFISAK